MAELILGSVLDSITGQALSLVSQEIGLARGVKLELKKLQDTVSIIGGVLREAEKRQVEAEDVKNWLQELKGVVYDADDLLDDYSTEALRRNIATGRGKRILNAVRIFFSSSSNQLIYASKMAHRVKEIREKIDAISNDRVRFQLEGSSNLVGSSVENRIAYPFESKPYVIGRDKDKKEVIGFLLDPHFDENVTILPIVGLGGLGKTTLARLVFNDESVGGYFKLKLWVCVSTDFIVKDILRKLVLECTRSKECDSLDMNELRKKLGEELGGKRFLIVLDDVWNENRDKWLDLQGLLANGEKGSKILVTTRTIRVARTMTPKYHHLSGLAEDESLTLLMKMAMKEEHEWRNQRFEEIGNEIVKKCCGVPLAITTIGRLLLLTRNTEEDWSSFKNNDLSSINQEQGDIMPSLKLSYDLMPSYLKRCFAYCCLFPKDYELDPSELIHLWMAQGFIKSPGNRMTLEEVGHGYFTELVFRCFFQDIREDVYGNILGCKMHDLMHDLAQLVEKDNCICMDDSDVKKIPEGARHVSIIGDLKYYGVKKFERDTRIRSLLLFDARTIRRFQVSHMDVSSFGNLRALRLLGLEVIVDSIGKLKHLRSLDLSSNSLLSFLPDSIGRLCNLETLNIRGCVQLKTLPAGITKLVNLRCLDAYRCFSLKYMPRGIGKLTNLQMLTLFVVGAKGNSKAATLNELNSLTRLKGELSIRHLERLGSSEADASFSIKKVRHLELSWARFRSEYSAKDEDVLERFRPHSDLKGLVIEGYAGARLSTWISQLQKLVKIKMSGCRSCTHLPPLDHLPFLKSVYLYAMSRLEWIEVSGSRALEQSFFPSLEQIELGDLPVFKGWKARRSDEDIQEEEDGSSSLFMYPTFSDKVSVPIDGCPRFSYMQGRLAHLVITTTKDLQQLLLKDKDVCHAPHLELPTRVTFFSMSSITLSAVTSLVIWKMEEAEHLPMELFQSLLSLQSLEVSECPRLKSLPVTVMLRYLTSLERLTICWCEELDLSIEIKDGNGGSEEPMKLLQGQSALNSLPGVFPTPHQQDMPNVQSSLRVLSFCGMQNMRTLPWWIQHLTKLEELEFIKCPRLKSLPVTAMLRYLTSLERLTIGWCEELDLSIEIKDGDGGSEEPLQPQGQSALNNLPGVFPTPPHQVDMPNVQSSLRFLSFCGMKNMRTLPWWIQHLTKLEGLDLFMCSNLEAFPDWFPQLTSLKGLHVDSCGDGLRKRCRRNTGEDWPKISHIQDLDIE